MDILIFSTVNLFTNKTLHRKICNIAKTLFSQAGWNNTSIGFDVTCTGTMYTVQYRTSTGIWFKYVLDFSPHLEIPATKTQSATIIQERGWGWEVEKLRGCWQVQSRHVLPPNQRIYILQKSVAKKEEYASGKVQRICSCQYSFQTSRPVLDHIHWSLKGKLLERFLWMYWCTLCLMWSLSCLKNHLFKNKNNGLDGQSNWSTLLIYS